MANAEKNYLPIQYETNPPSTYSTSAHDSMIWTSTQLTAPSRPKIHGDSNSCGTLYDFYTLPTKAATSYSKQLLPQFLRTALMKYHMLQQCRRENGYKDLHGRRSRWPYRHEKCYRCYVQRHPQDENGWCSGIINRFLRKAVFSQPAHTGQKRVSGSYSAGYHKLTVATANPSASSLDSCLYFSVKDLEV